MAAEASARSRAAASQAGVQDALRHAALRHDARAPRLDDANRRAAAVHRRSGAGRVVNVRAGNARTGIVLTGIVLTGAPGTEMVPAGAVPNGGALPVVVPTAIFPGLPRIHPNSSWPARPNRNLAATPVRAPLPRQEQLHRMTQRPLSRRERPRKQSVAVRRAGRGEATGRPWEAAAALIAIPPEEGPSAPSPRLNRIPANRIHARCIPCRFQAQTGRQAVPRGHPDRRNETDR